MDKNSQPPEPVNILSLDQLLSQTQGGVFSLVCIAMIRAREIHSGSPSLIDRRHSSSDKSTTIALEEIAQGKIGFIDKRKKDRL
ncbi:MAG: DNA-directed RNA polymerase subunit omega [Candidatus Omnitrophica bacterium]|nr:DNA-directed RNA polymerase subunit omega [Candidatus Omnitrophota bacterium]MDE2008721.1 DNA-directed RNA polymerase subunit omega [Candidatus Omnitrophota bacterium]MDE2214862.1 DNA-directed RNA polymerase subunit omega [Candidatus Omnitrophota bacterium]MDE2231982.1 DNA-directed RNA polymerase subunit omega [Candidatus Omnitrophota bacterium]